jgi:hypothetical protein
MRLFFATALLQLFVVLHSGAQDFLPVKDLSGDLLEFRDGSYVTADEDTQGKAVYVSLKPSQFSSEYLRIRADDQFAMFINGKLAAADEMFGIYDIDSLRRKYGASELLIGIYPLEVDASSVEIVSRRQAERVDVQRRSSSGFRDFAVIAILTLLILFTVLVRLNPKLTADYFSLNKIFSIRETDDTQLYTRITSSSNILFYIFCSMMVGFSLVLIFKYTSPQKGDTYFWIALLEWIKLSVIVLFIFFLKVALVYSLSILFGIKGAGRIHFFYWIRVLVVTGSLISIGMFLYFISRGQQTSVYEIFRWTITVVLILLIALVFLKLMRRAECSIFHLFSYICATEIIPFLITIKLLYQ